MITLSEYLMGRDKEYPLTRNMHESAVDLLCRVNYLLGWLQISARVSSGYRPGRYNKAAKGAPKSAHLTCQAVDLIDSKGSLGKLILDNKNMLDELGLWLENPEKTKGWVHLDTKKRANRIFNP